MTTVDYSQVAGLWCNLHTILDLHVILIVVIVPQMDAGAKVFPFFPTDKNP